MISPVFLVGVSGHRHLPHPELIGPSIEKALTDLSARAAQVGGRIELFSSIAYGADTIAVETARAMKIPVHIVLPKPIENHDETQTLALDEGFAADFWKDGVLLKDLWDRAWKQIKDARDRVDGGTLRLVRGAQTSPECYYDAGVQVLDSCDLLIVVWNGQPALGLGGTKDSVDLARERQLPLIIIDPETGVSTDERLDTFATVEDEGLKTMAQLAHDACLEDRHEPMTVPAARIVLSKVADSRGERFRNSLVHIILLHGIATAVAAVAASYGQASPYKWLLVGFAAVELVLVSRAVWKQWLLHHDHEQWMTTRFAGEIISGLRDVGDLLDPLTPLIARHHPQWRRFATAVAIHYYREQPKVSWIEQRKQYLSHRIKDQIAFFDDRQKKAAAIFRSSAKWTKNLGKAASLFVLGALVYKVMKATGHVHPGDMLAIVSLIAFTLFPIVLPLAVGLAVSLRTALDAGRRTYRYAEMVQRLTEARSVISSLKTASSTRRAIAATEEILIDELNEWQLAERQNGGH